MTEFPLTRNQVYQLAEIAAKFPESEWFSIYEDSTSGIGPTVTVRFSMFKDSHKQHDTTVDITDYSTW